MSVAGRSDSAAAKRADQQMTTNTVTRPARRLSSALTAVLSQEHRLNGFAGDSVVGVTVHEGLKPVAAEAVETAARMDAADLASTRTIVETANPGRSDTWYAAEVVRMQEEGRAVAGDE